MAVDAGRSRGRASARQGSGERLGLMGATMLSQASVASEGVGPAEAAGIRASASATLRRSTQEQAAAAAVVERQRAAADLRARAVVEVVRLEKMQEGEVRQPLVPPWPRPPLSTRQRSDVQLRVLELQRQLKNPNVEPGSRGEMLLKVRHQRGAGRAQRHHLATRRAAWTPHAVTQRPALLCRT